MVLDPNHHGLKLLNTLEERRELLAHAGLDNLVLHPFTKDLANLTPWEYAKTLLADCIKPVAVVIGDDHRFGRHRAGNFDTLVTLGQAFGFEVEALDAHRVEDVRVSSTKVRQALEAGRVDEANTWLSQPYPTTGTVVHGEALGRELGFPTANLHVDNPLKLLPARGVYAVWCQTPDGTWHPAMANVGTRPTIHDDAPDFFGSARLWGGGRLVRKALVAALDALDAWRSEVRFEGSLGRGLGGRPHPCVGPARLFHQTWCGMTWQGWRVGLLLVAMTTCTLAWGQARREGIPGVGAGTVWFDDLNEALTAHRAGTPVVALDLTRHKLQTLPGDLVELSALRVLMLHKNRLNDLPPWLAEMESLEVLLLDQNRFDTFPDVLLRMDRLETLSLGDNFIEEIPLDVDHMASLRHLGLWGNLIGRYPASLGDLPNLRTLDLLHNDMTAEEQELVSSMLPQVKVLMSEPCLCEFQDQPRP